MLKEKFERVFQKINNETSQHWRLDDDKHNLCFITFIKGQKIRIRLINVNENKINALLFIGDYRTDGNKYVSKKISFNQKKSEDTIKNDILKRLDMQSIGEKVEEIIDYRNKVYESKVKIENAIYLLQKLLPGLTRYKDRRTLSLYTNHTKVEIDLDEKCSRLEIVNYEGNLEAIMSAISQIGQYINK